jgi:hypothetical protein
MKETWKAQLDKETEDIKERQTKIMKSIDDSVQANELLFENSFKEKCIIK